MNNFSDKQILEGIRKGEDRLIIPELYRMVLPNLVKFICNNNGNEEEARDIFQDAILIFYNQVIDNTFNDKYKIGGYLYTISKNLWINRAVRKKKQVNVDDISKLEQVNTDPYESRLEQIEDEEKLTALNHIFSKLEEKCRELLTYTVYHKLSMREVAEKMGFTSENAAKTQNYRCKQSLMALVEGNKELKEVLR